MLQKCSFTYACIIVILLLRQQVALVAQNGGPPRAFKAQSSAGPGPLCHL